MSDSSVASEPVRRGRRVYGTEVGIVLVDTDLPRARGDIGNARTFDFPVAYGIARGAGTDQMVSVAPTDVATAFLATTQDLVAQGVSAVATSCGLLARDQQLLVQQATVPVATSSLLFASTILRILPAHAELGVLTIDSAALRLGGHFDGVGLSAQEQDRIRVAGMPGTSHFHQAIMGGAAELDVAAATKEVLGIAAQLRQEYPAIGALLLECTNLSPYTPALQRTTNLPVWDSTSLVRWLHEGLRSSLG